MSYSSKPISRLAGFIRPYGLVLIVFALASAVNIFLLPAQSSAVKNNYQNVRELTLRSLESSNQNVRSSPDVNNIGLNGSVNPYCNTSKKLWHFQDAWLSIKDKPTEVKATIDEGDSSIALQYNIIGGTCHRIFTSTSPKSSTINDTAKLSLTGTTITGANASVNGNNLGITWDKRDPGWQRSLADMDYGYAYSNNLRFVKQKDGMPNNRGLTVSGLSNLKADDYEILVEVDHIMVNRFGSNLYRCVNGGNETNDLNSSDKTCEPTARFLKIKLHVNKEYAGTCNVDNITEINGVPHADNTPVNLVPGDKFKAKFTVTNDGSRAWNLTDTDPVRLGTLNDTSVWNSASPTANRVNIDGVAFGGSVLGSHQSSEFVRDFRVSPTVGNVPNDFAWRIQRGGSQPIANMGECHLPINSPSNRPFLKVAGGDVVSGAQFIYNNSDGEPVYDVENSEVAPIKTNGISQAGGGSSSGQYGVFASGAIDSLVGGPANFYSNDYKMQNTRKDLTFANSGSGSEYGQFYGGSPSSYIVDISDMVALAKSGGEFHGGTSADNGKFRSHVSNTALSDGGSAYFGGENNASGGTYAINQENFTVNGSKVIVVNGNLRIDYDIKYATSGVPANMILIVLGNIYISPNVQTLDGTYIAFPTDNDHGVVDTCLGAGGAGEWTGLSTNAPCNKKLVINGRLIADKVLWKRTYGSLGRWEDAVNQTCVYVGQGHSPSGSSCAAELIDFSPEAYFNNPLGDISTTTTIGNIPISTTELPPIY